MDSITQALLGAAVGEALRGKRIGKKGAILGAIVGTIPDLDVLLTPFFSRLENISIHRGYSHSILFALLAGILFVFLLKRMKWTKGIDSIRLFTFTFLALFTHALLDAFTTYGTQLYLPFSDQRVSFDSMNIVDPVYTLPLLFGLLGSIFLSRRMNWSRSRPNTIGLVLSTAYLLFSLVNKQMVEGRFEQSLADQGIHQERLTTVPVKLANLSWYGVVHAQDSIYLGRFSYLDPSPITFESFAVHNDLLDDLDPHLVERMKWFAKDNYVVLENKGKIHFYNLQCDMQGVQHFEDFKAPTSFYFELHRPSDEGEMMKVRVH